MRFVKDDQRVGAEKSGMIGTHATRHAVAGKQEPRADHVDGADDNRRRRRVGEPFAIVRMLAAKR